MDSYDKAFLEFIRPMVNDKRIELLKKNIEARTRYITVVLEDIYQAQNASAVLRSCDCFGIQDVHIIENQNNFEVNSEVELGSAQWLSIYNYNKEADNTTAAIQYLKKKGYRIVATTPHINDVTLEEFDLHKGKTAIMMGTEMHGLTQTALDQADENLYIPMVGFTESLNISVSAAIILYHLQRKLMDSNLAWQLDPSASEEIMYQWIRNSVHRINPIETSFKKKLYS